MAKANQICIAPNNIVSLMTGVAYFQVMTGKPIARATYTDGSFETGEIPKDLHKALKAYHKYQTADGAACECPNIFSLVSAIQASARK